MLKSIHALIESLGLSLQKRAVHIQFSNPALNSQVFIQIISFLQFSSTTLRRLSFYERSHKRTDPAVHCRLQHTAEAHRPLMIDQIIFISLFGGIYHMNIKNNLIRTMQTIGQMRAVIGE